MSRTRGAATPRQARGRRIRELILEGSRNQRRDLGEQRQGLEEPRGRAVVPRATEGQPIAAILEGLERALANGGRRM